MKLLKDLPFGALLFVMACTFSLMSKFVPKKMFSDEPSEEAVIIKVCFTCRRDTDWKDVVSNYIRSAVLQTGIRFGVLVQCDSVGDVSIEEHREIRKITEVCHTTKIPSDHHTLRVRKIIKRFVNGSETIVLIVDPRIVPEYAWDRKLLNIPQFKRSMKDSSNLKDSSVVVSIPWSEHAVGFPTLRERSNGDVCRSSAMEMRFTDNVKAIPSVVICTEFMVAKPDVWIAWRKSRSSLHHLEYTLVPVFPVIEPNEKMEDDILDVNEHALLHPISHT